jgi:hypothetical protein
VRASAAGARAGGRRRAFSRISWYCDRFASMSFSACHGMRTAGGVGCGRPALLGRRGGQPPLDAARVYP